MLRLFQNIGFQISVSLVIIALCFWKFTSIQKEHVTEISNSVTYKSGITFKDFSSILTYVPKGVDDVSCGVLYEMDSLTWADMKAAGEDMLIKDAIVIDRLPKDTKPYDGPAGNIVCRTENNPDSLGQVSLHFDIDFSTERLGNIYWSYSGNIFGTSERGFKIYHSFISRSDTLNFENIVSCVSVRIPPDMEFNTIPGFSERTPERVTFKKDVLDRVYRNGLYMEGAIPKNVKLHDSIVFFLGALVGTFVSVIVSCLARWFSAVSRRRTMVKNKKSFTGTVPESVATETKK